MSDRKTQHADILNALDEMYSTPHYATRRDVLLRAQQIIIAQEQALDEKRAGWIGVDLDGTLAEYNGWQGINHIGAPVRTMLSRVRKWIEDGRDVRIFTARVSHDGSPKRMLEAQHAMIRVMDWCEQHIGRSLPVTCTKDFAMLELWDDRAVQVTENVGEPVGYSTRGLS